MMKSLRRDPIFSRITLMTASVSNTIGIESVLGFVYKDVHSLKPENESD